MRRALLLLFLLLLPMGVCAQTVLTPDKYALNLKGILKTNGGTPLPNGNISVQFRLYGGTGAQDPLVWSETQTVNVFTTPSLVPAQADKKGRYSVTLGYQTPSLLKSFFYNGNAIRTLWLEIWVNNVAPPAGTLRKQILQITADSTISKSMNQVIWVTNALDHIEQRHFREAAGFAFYVRKLYEAIPDADPNFVVLSLIKAQGTFNQQYRSPNTGDFRVSMLPIDAITNLYGTLVQQPGNPITIPIIGESLKFAAGTLNLASGNKAYQQFSYELGRMSSAGSFNDYQNNQLERLYLLARQNKKVATVVDTFFGFGFNAKVSDSLFAILDKNVSLRDSANFAPLKSQIEADGTMLSTLETATANVADFYDRMTKATLEMTAGMGKVTQLQQNNYVGSSSPSTAAGIQSAITTAFQNAAPNLVASKAGVYATQVQMLDTSAYDQYTVTVDGLNLAAGIAATAADTIRAIADVATLPPNPVAATADGISAVGNAASTVAAGLTLAADLGAFGPSQEDAIADGVLQLSAQLSAVQQQIDQRLTVMDGHIVALYDQMGRDFASMQQAISQGFTALGNQIDKLTADVVNIQYGLDRLTQSFSTFESQSLRATNLVPHLTIINNWDTTPPPTDPPTAGIFNNEFAFCQAYALSTSLAQGENGNLGQDGYASLTGDSNLLGNLDTDPSKNLNYLLGFVGKRFVNRTNEGYVTPNVNPLSRPQVANPAAWEMSSIGMMRAVTIYPNLGLRFIQTDHSGFDGAFSIGRNLQDAANSITLQGKVDPTTSQPVFQNGVQVIEKSPVLGNMLLHQQKMATALSNAIQTRAAFFVIDYPNHHPAGQTPTNAEKVADIADQINQNGTTVSIAANNLDGSRRVLEQMCEFGLSRSVKTVDQLSSLLYSGGSSNFYDTQGTPGSADPNAQRLPDGTLVRAMYHNWVTSIPAKLSVSPTATATSGPATSTPLPAGTYYVAISYTVTPPAGGASEAPLSPETPVSITLGKQIVVTAPSVPGGTLNYRVYIGKSSGGPYFLQNRAGGTVGANFSLNSPILSDISIPPAKQYNQYITGDPLVVFNNAQTERWNSLKQLVVGGFVNTAVSGPPVLVYANGLLDNLASDANGNRTGTPLGEQIGTVDAVMSRLGFFLIPTVNGTVTGKPLPNLPANQQPKSLANSVVQMQFNGLLTQFSALVMLDANGAYTVYVPRDKYGLLVKTDSFLQSYVRVPGALVGVADTRSATVLNANAQLGIGDIIGDNKINNSDLIAVRNALGSRKLLPTWIPKFDLNGDGVVDFRDQILLQGALNSTPADSRWVAKADLSGPNGVPDGVIDNFDQAVVFVALGSTPGASNWNIKADLNGDGIVDYRDQEILQGKIGTTPGSFNWDARFDLDANGNVGSSDITAMNGALGTRASSLNWNPFADLNGDGVVDLLDLGMVRYNFGQNGEQ